MTTTPDPEGGEPVAAMEIARTVSALIVEGATAYAALWSATRTAVPDDVRVVIEAVDQLGRQHHLSLSPVATVLLLAALTDAHADALRKIDELS